MALLKDAGRSLAEQLTDRFAERIGTGLLAPGARLPSVRQCAEAYRYFKATACKTTFSPLLEPNVYEMPCIELVLP